MPDVIRTQSSRVLDNHGLTDGGHVRYADDEGSRDIEVHVTVDAWEDMGRPDHLSVTVRPRR